MWYITASYITALYGVLESHHSIQQSAIDITLVTRLVPIS